MDEREIDWSGFTFSGDICYCRCGGIFRSHAKAFYAEGRLLVTRKPCPSCNQNDNCCRIESEPETFTIRR